MRFRTITRVTTHWIQRDSPTGIAWPHMATVVRARVARKGFAAGMQAKPRFSVSAVQRQRSLAIAGVHAAAMLAAAPVYFFLRWCDPIKAGLLKPSS
jgi:hypothetical protein